MNELNKIIKALTDFRDQRNWAQFHNPKDLALALSIEAAELNELFLWKNGKEVHNINTERIKEELADVLAFAFLMAEKYNFDIPKIMLKKIKQNALKYPVEKARNSSKKYDELK